VGRLAWSQLRFRAVRLVALLAGMLVATTAFTVLTAASRTAQLRTTGTVSAHFVPAYEILVRPPGSRTALETKTNTVQPNFLTGITGGITMAQYHQIAAIPGVQVAAPIAMIGYSLLEVFQSFPLPAADYDRSGRQLYRISTTWVSDNGTSRVTQPPSYLYVTPNSLRFEIAAAGGTRLEDLPGGASAPVCPSLGAPPEADPFGIAAQSGVDCWSKVDGAGTGLPGALGSFLGRRGPATFYVSWEVPLLIAAVDPAAEAKLDGLNHALISGRYLSESARPRSTSAGLASFPVLAASSVGMDEYAQTRLQLLAPPTAAPQMNVGWLTQQATASAQTVLTVQTTAQQAYQGLRRELVTTTTGGAFGAWAVWGYWTVGPTSYRHAASGALTPRLVSNPASAWYTGGVQPASVDNADNQYRAVTVHAPTIDLTQPHQIAPGAPRQAIASLVGVFNPAKVTSFDPLSQVPLGAYQPVTAAPAAGASRTALGGRDLLPNQNLGGYVSQPVDLITTLSALPALENSYYGDAARADAPISAIRVRVAGVSGPNQVSLERIREVAQQIELRTHLQVDIVAGSSPSPTTIDLPRGKFGQPALTLTEGWVRKGVAITILTAIDRSSLVLFTLILVVCVLFVGNSAAVAIRGRRRELGVLACLGWTRPRLFAAVLGELAGIGLAAGVLGAVTALPLSAALGLHASARRAALAVPVAVAVAILAGLLPAWLAARAEPVAAIRPAVRPPRRARQAAGLTALAAVNVLRTSARSMVGAVSLAVGIAALTVVAALTFAFRGVVVGSLLGNAVAVQVRGVDYVAVAATVTLGVLAVADVVFLNIRERASELAAFRAFGWRGSTVRRLVITEGAIIGLAGSLAGAALGLAGAAAFTGQLPVALWTVTSAAVAAGTIVIVFAALLPALALQRLPAAQLLAED
jgi:putative ABC transport system permease protein